MAHKSGTQSTSAQIFRKVSISYYYSSLFLPKEIRDDVFDFYAYVRTADDFVDRIPPQSVEFKRYVRETRRALEGKRVTDPHITKLAHLAHKYSFDHDWIYDFLKAMESDLNPGMYTTYRQLQTYMYGSAEVIGLCLCKIFRLSSEAHTFARAQGEAMQVINFVRDIAQDYALGRQYIPNEDCQTFSTHILPRKGEEGAFKKLVLFEIDRYIEIQKKSEMGYVYLPRRIRFAVKTAADMYMWTAKQIQKNPMRVLEGSIKPPAHRVVMQACINAIRVCFQPSHSS